MASAAAPRHCVAPASPCGNDYRRVSAYGKDYTDAISITTGRRSGKAITESGAGVTQGPSGPERGSLRTIESACCRAVFGPVRGRGIRAAAPCGNDYRRVSAYGNVYTGGISITTGHHDGKTITRSGESGGAESSNGRAGASRLRGLPALAAALAAAPGPLCRSGGPVQKRLRTRECVRKLLHRWHFDYNRASEWESDYGIRRWCRCKGLPVPSGDRYELSSGHVAERFSARVRGRGSRAAGRCGNDYRRVRVCGSDYTGGISITTGHHDGKTITGSGESGGAESSNRRAGASRTACTALAAARPRVDPAVRKRLQTREGVRKRLHRWHFDYNWPSRWENDYEVRRIRWSRVLQ